MVFCLVLWRWTSSFFVFICLCSHKTNNVHLSWRLGFMFCVVLLFLLRVSVTVLIFSYFSIFIITEFGLGWIAQVFFFHFAMSANPVPRINSKNMSFTHTSQWHINVKILHFVQQWSCSTFSSQTGPSLTSLLWPSAPSRLFWLISLIVLFTCISGGALLELINICCSGIFVSVWNKPECAFFGSRIKGRLYKTLPCTVTPSLSAAVSRLKRDEKSINNLSWCKKPQQVKLLRKTQGGVFEAQETRAYF